MEISFTEMLSILVKRIVVIIAGTIIGLLLFYMLNKYMISPYYTASVQLYVNSRDESDAASELTSLTYAQKVVNTYINFLQTQSFYSKVCNESGLNYSTGEVRTMTKIKPVNNTEIFSISVTTKNAKDTYQLVSAMQKVAPELIREIKGNDAKICVVDPAVFPSSRSGPNTRQNTLIGGILGLFLAVIMAVVMELFNNKVKSKEDLKKKYNNPIIGMIPDFQPIHRKAVRMLRKIPITRRPFISSGQQDKNNDALKFLCTEAYNTLRSNLRFLLRNDNCKKIVISSPNSVEGKSTTSVNLAVAIAQTGAKVLLMDCDLRKGTVHNFFELNSTPGVSDVLSKSVSEAEVTQNTKYDNLTVIQMGMIPPNPAELIGSTQMEEFIKQMENEYDYILFDTPPVNLVSDVFGLTRYADGVILVIKEQFTAHPDIIEAINKYELAQAHILGFVLNGYQYESNDKRKYHSNYYYKIHE
jgi:capsular exopolysaccharide synthesis family protein